MVYGRISTFIKAARGSEYGGELKMCIRDSSHRIRLLSNEIYKIEKQVSDYIDELSRS